MKYFAILKDSLREARDSRVLYVMFALSTAVILVLATISFKPHTAAFLGYLISHESHHRGQIALSLKQAGKPLDKKIGFGMWEWGVR